jgi:hypothetical protein
MTALFRPIPSPTPLYQIIVEVIDEITHRIQNMKTQVNNYIKNQIRFHICLQNPAEPRDRIQDPDPVIRAQNQDPDSKPMLSGR